MVDNVLTKSSKTSRGALDPEKVLLLKSMILKHFIKIKLRLKSYCFIDAMIYKYSFAIDRQDKAWVAVNSGIQEGATLDGNSI